MEHLLEYQDYVLAYRLRALVGGKTRPLTSHLSLAEYAQKRLKRQVLAKEMIAKDDYHLTLRQVEKLTEELNFGFWHNPGESVEFLKKMIEQGGCRAIESNEGFVDELLTRRERAGLKPAERDLIAVYYLGLLRASAAYLDAEIFTRLRAEVEPLRDRMPIFVLPTDADVPSL